MDWERLGEEFGTKMGKPVFAPREIRRDTMLDPATRDFRDKRNIASSAAQRVCEVRFREDGVLLPYGASRHEFDTANP